MGGGGGGVARHVAEPGMPEQVVPVGMGGEPGDHRSAELVQIVGELVQIGTIDAGIDQDQPSLPAHRDGIAPDPRALPNPDAVGHLIQHRFTVSGGLRATQPATAWTAGSCRCAGRLVIAGACL